MWRGPWGEGLWRGCQPGDPLHSSGAGGPEPRPCQEDEGEEKGQDSEMPWKMRAVRGPGSEGSALGDQEEARGVMKGQAIIPGRSLGHVCGDSGG